MVAELGNPPKNTNSLKSWCDVDATGVRIECHIQVTDSYGHAIENHQLA